MVNNWINIIRNNWLLPSCILCGNQGFNGMDLCSHCFAQFELNQSQCLCCAQPFEDNTAGNALCGQCQLKPPAFDQVFAPFLYAGNMRYLITTLKFNANYKNARLMAQLMISRLNGSMVLPECLIPMPLHHKRYKQRGFNQAIEIAKGLSAQLNIPTVLTGCARIRDTAHQTGQSAKNRKKNLNQAFRVIKPLTKQHVAIIDDVMTTGSTANELAATLKKHGVCKVDVWVCGRA
ncbi:MAG: phosphoribosyltransferase [Methylobacter sp.]|nr:MAG: phosphoribosyltransferase [Methylobacter sp.]PPD22984.1 MAG: phosphoribosyltransferase [Methylobacter sp.]PPD37426.1 MAG: phosphoribosyltransferase [Methylomonas sp.]